MAKGGDQEIEPAGSPYFVQPQSGTPPIPIFEAFGKQQQPSILRQVLLRFKGMSSPESQGLVTNLYGFAIGAICNPVIVRRAAEGERIGLRCIPPRGMSIKHACSDIVSQR